MCIQLYITVYWLLCIVYTEMLKVTGKQEEDLVTSNQRLNMMSLEVMEANKKQQDAIKHSKSLEQQCALLKKEKQELAQQ